MRIALTSLVLTFIASWPGATQAQAPDFVSASYNVDRAYVVVTLNGFPILNDSSRYGLSGGGPVNLHLVPTGNRLDIQFQPQITADSLEYATFDLALDSGNQGDIVGTDEVGDLLNVSLNGTEGAQTVVETFDLPEAWRDQFTSGRLYEEAPVIGDAEQVKDYALRLFGMLEAGAYDAFAREAVPRMRAYRAAYPTAGLPEDDAALQDLFRNTLEQMMGGMRLNTDVHAENLAPIPWADGRVWEVRLTDGRPLITATDDEGGLASIPVFIARVDGDLRLVR